MKCFTEKKDLSGVLGLLSQRASEWMLERVGLFSFACKMCERSLRPSQAAVFLCSASSPSLTHVQIHSTHLISRLPNRLGWYWNIRSCHTCSSFPFVSASTHFFIVYILGSRVDLHWSHRQKEVYSDQISEILENILALLSPSSLTLAPECVQFFIKDSRTMRAITVLSRLWHICLSLCFHFWHHCISSLYLCVSHSVKSTCLNSWEYGAFTFFWKTLNLNYEKIHVFVSQSLKLCVCLLPYVIVWRWVNKDTVAMECALWKYCCLQM